MNEVYKIQELFDSGNIELAMILCNSLSTISCIRGLIVLFSNQLDLIRKASKKNMYGYNFYFKAMMTIECRGNLIMQGQVLPDILKSEMIGVVSSSKLKRIW